MGQLAGVNWAAFITGHGWMPVYTSWEIGRVQLYLCKAVRTQWFISNCTFTAHFSVSFPYISLFKSWVVRHCPWRKSDVSWADPRAMEAAHFSDQNQALGTGWGSVWVLWCSPAAGCSRFSWGMVSKVGMDQEGTFPLPVSVTCSNGRKVDGKMG